MFVEADFTSVAGELVVFDEHEVAIVGETIFREFTGGDGDAGEGFDGVDVQLWGLG